MRDFTDNVFIGGGFEVHSGLTLMTGLHLGEVNKLISDNPSNIITGRKWKSGLFFSLYSRRSII